MKYLVSCISGLQDVIWENLPRAVGPATLLAKEEGLLVFEGNSSPQQVRSVPYLNNCFLVLDQPVAGGSLSDALRALPHSDAWHLPLSRSVTPNERTFRLVLSDENQLVAGDRNSLAQLRSTIAWLTHMKDSPRGAHVEFWILRRRSGQVYLCKRLSRRSRTEDDLRKGELRPELAHLLCLISEPAPADIFLDPFAGSGAIAFARAHYLYNMIFAFDIEPSNVEAMKSKVKENTALTARKKSPLIVRLADARKLDRIQDGFIDKVVTDPPWGFFDTSLADPASLYRTALAELCRVTKVGGIIVLLLGDRNLAGEVSTEFSDRLELVTRFDILVSGKKAVIYKWRLK